MFIEDVQPGDKVRFVEEKQAYKVQARSDRFIVCNKPFNLQRTVLYTIVDLKMKVRGPENLVFGFGAETQEQCAAMVERLKADTEISHRHVAPLNVAEVIKAPTRFCGFCNRTAGDGQCSMCREDTR